MFEKGLVGIHEVGTRHLLVPARMADESLLQRQVADRIASLVIAQQAVEAARRAREEELSDPDVGLEGSRSAQSDERQLPFLGLLLPRGEVHVGQGVELRDADVDVADSDTRREHGHAFAAVGARYGTEFAVRNLALPGLEMLRHEGHPTGVADQDDRVGHLLGTQVKMENRTVVVDNQFGSRNRPHKILLLNFHNWHKSNIFTSNIKTSPRNFISVKDP